MTLRYARVADSDGLSVLDSRVFGELGYPAFVLTQMIEVNDQNIEVVLADGDVVAYCFATRSYGSDCGWLLSLGVDRQFRRRGVGRSLTVRALERLAVEGARAVRLTVDPANTAAVQLYRSLGFDVRENMRDYFGAGQDRSLMERVF